MSKKKPKVYVKQQLCKEFGISERALKELTSLELLDLQWSLRHGLKVVELSDADKEVLESAKNSPYNKHPFRLPFMRYLSLRFMQMPLEFIEYEIGSKNLLDLSRYDSNFLQRRYDQFMAGVPEDLKPCIEAYSPPKSAKEKRLFEILLDVCEIRIAYENPEWDEAFSFMTDPNVKTIVDCMLSTSGSYEDISDTLHELLGVEFSPEGLLFYQQLMHDVNHMDSNDLKYYLKGIAPSRKVEIQKAYGQSLEAYKLTSGLQVNIKTEEVVDIALTQISKKLLSLTSSAAPADANEVYHALRAFNMLQDRRGKLGAAATSRQSSEVDNFWKRLDFAPQEPESGLLEISEDDFNAAQQHKNRIAAPAEETIDQDL